MEIERKWLIKKDKIPYNLSELESHSIEQIYISLRPTIRARKIDGEKYILTIKTKTLDNSELARNEYELELCRSDYVNLFDNKKGHSINKTRYIHYLGNGLKEEIDIFEGFLEGLAYMEIEFDSIEAAESYPDPDWVEKDVTYDGKYKNAALTLIDNISDLIEK